MDSAAPHIRLVTLPFAELTPADYLRITCAREEVFFLEQHITCGDADRTDSRSLFMQALDGEELAGFLRIVPPGVVCAEASIGRVLVRAPYRRRGLCRRMMRAALDRIGTEWPGTAVRIAAQSYLTGFYAELGFEIVSGPFSEAGIPHRMMLRK